MKKLFFVIVTLCIMLSVNVFSTRKILNSDGEGIAAIQQDEIYNFEGTIYWNGDVGKVTFLCPDGTSPYDLRIREYSREYLDIVDLTSNTFTIEIKKELWEFQGSPSSFSFSLFRG